MFCYLYQVKHRICHVYSLKLLEMFLRFDLFYCFTEERGFLRRFDCMVWLLSKCLLCNSHDAVSIQLWLIQFLLVLQMPSACYFEMFKKPNVHSVHYTNENRLCNILKIYFYWQEPVLILSQTSLHWSNYLKELCHGILSYFDHRPNYLEIERNLKMILYEDGKTPKR